MPVNVTATLRRALRQLEIQRTRIDEQIAAIRSVLGAGSDSTRRPGSPPRRRRRMSATAGKAVTQRMKAYWAKRKGRLSKAKTAARKAR